MARKRKIRIPLPLALIGLIGVALLAGLVPGGIVLSRRLAAAIEDIVRADLTSAPRLLADRESMSADMLAMHARDLAGVPGLGEALAARDRGAAVRLVERAATAPGERPVLIDRAGQLWTGTEAALGLTDATRVRGDSVTVTARDTLVQRIALVPVVLDGVWVGAVGVSEDLGITTASILSGLTRAETVILAGSRRVTASTAGESLTAFLADTAIAWRGDGALHVVRPGDGARYLVAVSPLGGSSAVAFARNLDTALGILPRLKRTAVFAAAWAMALALALAVVLAVALARPVRILASAADRLAGGDFEAPIPDTVVREIDRVARAFDQMRRVLSARLQDLEAANRELEDRQRRLSALQAEFLQRERLAASGQLVAELAHEIRNPVANVQNCLEVLKRRLDRDEAGREFADMAIDELLRMHELAERMLDLNRPHDAESRTCRPFEVASDVAALVRAGTPETALTVTVHGERGGTASIPPDVLKQVVLNLVQNAREAVKEDGRIDLRIANVPGGLVIDVEDDGHGIPEEVLPKLFDPFFTTKNSVQGVGLGLYIAEGVVRRYGGRITAANREPGPGARFRIELALAAQPEEHA